jgi:hypothetical protein
MKGGTLPLLLGFLSMMRSIALALVKNTGELFPVPFY